MHTDFLLIFIFMTPLLLEWYQKRPFSDYPCLHVWSCTKSL